MKKYGLIVENSKEFNDYIEILNELSLRKNIHVKIVYLANVYKDELQNKLIHKINFNYDILPINNPYNISFTQLSSFKKVIIVLKSKKKIFQFLYDCDVILSGVQTVFQRLFFCKIKSIKSSIITFVYHRHLLFDDKVNTIPSRWKSHFITKYFFKFVGLDGFFIDHKAVGYADFYIVLGNINKNYLISNGIDDKLIFPLGSLEYDSLSSIKEKDKGNKTSICYITAACEWIGDSEGEEYQYKKILEYLNYFKNKTENYDVWIRVHPRENIEKYKKLELMYDFLKLQYFCYGSLLEDLNQFDILIGGTSTALFEACLLPNKKIVFFILNEELYRYQELIDSQKLPYINVLSDEEFSKALAMSIIGNNYITYRKEEKAISRIVNLLEMYYE